MGLASAGRGRVGTRDLSFTGVCVEMPTIKTEEMGLLTDIYELTMAQSYFQHGMFAPATFSLFIRRYPPNRSYFVAAGLEDVLSFLENWHFSKEEVDYLRSTGIFADDFLDYLAGVKFTGAVWAMPEGGLFFADEPVLEGTAPIIEAQIVETYIINQVNFQTLIATKAARCIWAAKGRPLLDFAFRRTHGVDAAMKVSRASYIAGFQSTSNVSAGKRYGIPVSGTMAHSFVTSHHHELDAFRAFASSFPDRCILLIDTYDTAEGAMNAVAVAREMEGRGQRLRGVRLDSGDLRRLSREVRTILNDAGMEYVNIVASGGLDEFEIDDLVRTGAPIDGFGVGTKMGVSDDAPWSDMAYKLVQYDGRPVLKLSSDKISLPGEKQVIRFEDGLGNLSEDIITLRGERSYSEVSRADSPRDESEDHTRPMDGKPLLQKVMEEGRTIQPEPRLDEIKARFSRDFHRLEDQFKALTGPTQYEVSLSPGLKRLNID